MDEIACLVSVFENVGWLDRVFLLCLCSENCLYLLDFVSGLVAGDCVKVWLSFSVFVAFHFYPFCRSV